VFINDVVLPHRSHDKKIRKTGRERDCLPFLNQPLNKKIINHKQDEARHRPYKSHHKKIFAFIPLAKKAIIDTLKMP